jgi:uncharacterized pyridoxamine 5'-phosphate oxidase family protein
MSKPELPVEKLVVADPHRFLYDFFGRYKLAVLSTVDGSTPEAAVIQYSELTSLELIFETSESYRKYRNMQSNPRVALVVGWDDFQTVQYEGIASELTEPERQKCREVHLKKFPEAVVFEEFSGNTYFKVKPLWIRYTDHTEFPRKRFEIKFD